MKPKKCFTHFHTIFSIKYNDIIFFCFFICFYRLCHYQIQTEWKNLYVPNRDTTASFSAHSLLKLIKENNEECKLAATKKNQRLQICQFDGIFFVLVAILQSNFANFDMRARDLFKQMWSNVSTKLFRFCESDSVQWQSEYICIEGSETSSQWWWWRWWWLHAFASTRRYIQCVLRRQRKRQEAEKGSCS